MMKGWIAALLLTGLLTACGKPSQADLTTLARGAYSGITTQEAVLITSFAEWDRLWQRHASRFAPPPAPPPVDFSQASVIALFLGERPTGGYSLTIAHVSQQGESLRVTAVERRPEPGAIVTQALTQPYHMVAIPRVKQGTRLEVKWQVRSATTWPDAPPPSPPGRQGRFAHPLRSPPAR